MKTKGVQKDCTIKFILKIEVFCLNFQIFWGLSALLYLYYWAEHAQRSARKQWCAYWLRVSTKLHHFSSSTFPGYCWPLQWPLLWPCMNVQYCHHPFETTRVKAIYGWQIKRKFAVLMMFRFNEQNHPCTKSIKNILYCGLYTTVPGMPPMATFHDLRV